MVNKFVKLVIRKFVSGDLRIPLLFLEGYGLNESISTGIPSSVWSYPCTKLRTTKLTNLIGEESLC